MAKKWMQAEGRRQERAGTKGALRKQLGAKDSIPTSRLRSIQSRLSAKAKKGKLTASELKLSQRVNFALRARGR